MINGQTYYEILGVRPDATEAVIKMAYRTKAMEFHPDQAVAADAEERFKEIQEAYHWLSDPSRRAEYDAALKEIRRRAEEQERQQRAERERRAQEEQQRRDAEQAARRRREEEKRRRTEQAKKQGRGPTPPPRSSDSPIEQWGRAAFLLFCAFIAAAVSLIPLRIVGGAPSFEWVSDNGDGTYQIAGFMTFYPADLSEAEEAALREKHSAPRQFPPKPSKKKPKAAPTAPSTGIGANNPVREEGRVLLKMAGMPGHLANATRTIPGDFWVRLGARIGGIKGHGVLAKPNYRHGWKHGMVIIDPCKVGCCKSPGGPPDWWTPNRVGDRFNNRADYAAAARHVCDVYDGKEFRGEVRCGDGDAVEIYCTPAAWPRSRGRG